MELSLVDITPGPQSDPPRKEPESGAAPQISAPNIKLVGAVDPVPADPFLDEARREYQEGRVDLPLWSHVISKQTGDQQEVVDAYLKARATSLRLEHRERGGGPLKPRLDAAKAPPRPQEAAPATTQAAAKPSILALLHDPKMRKTALFALPGLVLLIIALGWMLSGNKPDATQNGSAGSNAATVAPKTTKAVKPAPVDRPKEVDPMVALVARIQDLKAAGNWNVFVLHAAEWTRQQPQNAAAWRELSFGYSSLNQYSDALEAGTKATQLAPQDPLGWRNLGQVNLDLKEPEAALAAFERAVALDAGDLSSQLRIGEINAQLNRLPQARAAYESVLAANPDNPDALCGTVQVAQRQGRGKEVENAVRALRGTGFKCDDSIAAAAAAAPKALHPGATMVPAGSDAVVAVPKAHGAGSVSRKAK